MKRHLSIRQKRSSGSSGSPHVFVCPNCRASLIATCLVTPTDAIASNTSAHLAGEIGSDAHVDNFDLDLVANFIAFTDGNATMSDGDLKGDGRGERLRSSRLAVHVAANGDDEANGLAAAELIGRL